MVEGVHAIFNAQRSLSCAQSTPMIGALVSVPKALLSFVEIISGIALGMLFGIIGTLFGHFSLLDRSILSFSQSFLGFESLLYSISNLATLSFLGFYCECGSLRGTLR